MSEKFMMNYNEMQEREYINDFVKLYGGSKISVYKPNDELPGLIMKGGKDENKSLISSGLGKLHFNGRNFTGVEVMMNVSVEFDVESEDMNILIDQMYDLCRNQAIGYCDGYVVRSCDTTAKFRERFGYEYVVFLSGIKRIKITDVGDIMILLALPMYEEEYQLYLGWFDKEKSRDELIDRIIDYYEEKKIHPLAVDVERSLMIREGRGLS